MIRFSISRKDQHFTGFTCEGHAGYADMGEDIICAAVSVLLINTINSIESFTEDPFEVEQAEDGGYLKLVLKDTPSDATELLMNSLLLGMKSILEEYGEDFIQIKSRNK